MRWVTARRLFLLAVLVAAALVAIRVTVPERTRLTLLEAMFRDAIAPVQTGFNWLGKQTSHLISFPVSMYRAGERNQALEEKVASLESQIIQLNEYKLENERLTSLLNYKQVMAETYDLIAASVVGRDPGNWFGNITLNRGTSDGVEENMTVLTPEGLVGRVISVSSSTCEVLLITDPRSGVGSIIQDTRTSGIVEGTTASSGMTRMIHIPNSATVEAGQVVITSGLGSIFPKNIPVGRITDIRSEPSGMFNSADIQPFADLSRLEEVLIISGTHP
ncbi:rod shape-determining protein MreC [Pelotomaculum terephthalicicum JT]|uniref:rod shape-determining protein MreC n=2 Tax=Pelotomaculum TaxID=191373 RepID=UPI001F038A75|nr:rod shape-determining protein MreC [Pelotomaculum terephthalicicum]MCG9966995.1 rod shape-determining protein MreC [Pelotomaculum terephthalicicum JT]